MKKHLFKLLFSSLVVIFFSCNKKQLNNDEINVVNKFLACEWYDLAFVSFSGETIPNEARFIFKIENSKLKHIRNTYYSASFGDKNIHDEGDVKIFYDKEKEGVVLELLNKNNEVIDEGLIKIPRDKIISTFTEQIKNREKIISILKNRKYTQLSDGEFDQRGIFESMISRSFQSSDFNMNYVYDRVTHYENLGSFQPLKIEGFYSTAGKKGIDWTLKEIFIDSTQKEVRYEDLKKTFKSDEIIVFVNKLIGPLRYFDSNISDAIDFNSNNFKLEFNNNIELNDDYGLKSKLTIPVTNENFNFLKKWYGNSDNVFDDIELVKTDNDEYNVFINFKNSVKSGGDNWLRVYNDLKDPSRIFFFNQNKYFALMSSN